MLVKIPEIKEKIIDGQRKSTFRYKNYILPSNKIIKILGYEPQFLNHIFDKKLLREEEINYNPQKIKYIGVDKKEHHYFPDFYIPKFNLIVEIKSTWIMQYDKNVYAKETFTKQAGFNYIRIIDNKFQEFENTIKMIV